jgi:hypothetical protein
MSSFSARGTQPTAAVMMSSQLLLSPRVQLLVPRATVESGESGVGADTAASRQSRQCGVRPRRKRREVSAVKTTCEA